MSCLVVWLISCDTTIHEYPQTEESALILLELNTDRTPPQYYKEVTYDHEAIIKRQNLRRLYPVLISQTNVLACV